MYPSYEFIWTLQGLNERRFITHFIHTSCFKINIIFTKYCRFTPRGRQHPPGTYLSVWLYIKESADLPVKCRGFSDFLVFLIVVITFWTRVFKSWLHIEIGGSGFDIWVPDPYFTISGESDLTHLLWGLGWAMEFFTLPLPCDSNVQLELIIPWFQTDAAHLCRDDENPNYTIEAGRIPPQHPWSWIPPKSLGPG